MTPLTTAKLVLALAGLAVFVVGVRSDVNAVRWTGIALVAAAWLLRIAARRSKADAATDADGSA